MPPPISNRPVGAPATAAKPALRPATPKVPAAPPARVNWGDGGGPKASDDFQAGAVGTKAAPPVLLNDLSVAAQRQRVARLPQSNGVSKGVGNEGSICAGAALTNAVMLSSGNPAAAKANAAALTQAASLAGMSGDPGVKTALDHLATGRVSDTDAFQLQQVLYNFAGKFEPGAGAGVTTLGMASAVGQLKEFGAQLDPSLRLALIQNPDTDAHWVTTQGGAIYNSMPSNGVGGIQLRPTDPTWVGDITMGKQARPQLRQLSADAEGVRDGKRDLLKPNEPRYVVLQPVPADTSPTTRMTDARRFEVSQASVKVVTEAQARAER
jgi:hypothetical protein